MKIQKGFIWDWDFDRDTYLCRTLASHTEALFHYYPAVRDMLATREVECGHYLSTPTMKGSKTVIHLAAGAPGAMKKALERLSFDIDYGLLPMGYKPVFVFEYEFGGKENWDEYRALIEAFEKRHEKDIEVIVLKWDR